MEQWQVVSLGDLLTESKIESTKPDSSNRIRVKLNLGGIEKRPSLNEKKGATKYFIRKSGQFIYGKQNLHKGAFGIIPLELDGYESSSDLPAFDIDDRCFPEWILYFFKQGDFFIRLSSLAKGVGSKRINPSQLFNLKISLPPKEDQREILDAVKTFEVDSIHLKIELNKQIGLLKNIKSSFLNESLDGIHTTEYRLKKSQGRKGKNDFSNLNEIPIDWKKVKLGEYVHCERGRFSARPRNDPKFFNGSIPYIQIGDLPTDGGYIMRHNQTLNELGLTVSKLFPKNTIAIAIVGATIGNTGILNYEMCFPDSLVGIKPSAHFNTNFIEYFLRSKKEYFRALAYSGGGQPNIKLPNITSCDLLLPPIQEQKLIVDKINSVFSKCDELIGNIMSQLKNIDLLFKTELSRIWKTENVIPNNSIMNKEVEERIYQKLLDTLKEEVNDESKDLEDLLKSNGKMSAVSLWQLSKFSNNIDSFYEHIKILIEEKKTVKESEEKGYLEILL